MNTSQYTDKQIMALSGSQGGSGDIFDLMNPQEERQESSSNGSGLLKEDILPSFQPIRGAGSSPMNAGIDVAARRGSVDSKMGSSGLKFSSMSEPYELTKASHGKEREAYDVTAVTEIDRAVKKHADKLLIALEGVSSRLSQLESRTSHLESSVDELKVSVANNNGSTDGKLRQLENIVREAQGGIQVLRDKQGITEAQLQLAKLQASMTDHLPAERSDNGKPDSRPLPPQQASQPSVQQLPQPPIAPPQLPQLPLPPPNDPPPQLEQNPPVQFPTQLPPSQVLSVPSLPREPYFQCPAQSTDTAHQKFPMPSQQSQQLPPAQHYQSSPQLLQFPQPMQPLPSLNPSQFQSPSPPHPEESAPYMTPSQAYAPSIRQPAPPSHSSAPPPPQQYYGPNPSMYEPPANRPGSGQLSFPAGYGPPSGPSFSDQYPYSGSPSHYSSSVKPSPFASSAPSSGGSNYQRLPSAQILPQAMPTGSGSSIATGNRVPVDDVVDKVSTMGFSREQVRAAVRRLTENGQSVDLNVVLDKLMNDGEIQPQKGWLGR